MCGLQGSSQAGPSVFSHLLTYKFLTFLPHNLSSSNLDYLQFFIFSTCCLLHKGSPLTAQCLLVLQDSPRVLILQGNLLLPTQSMWDGDPVLFPSTSCLPCFGIYHIIYFIILIFLLCVSVNFSKVETIFHILFNSLMLACIEYYVNVNWRNKTELSVKWNSAIISNDVLVSWLSIFIFMSVSNCLVILSIFLS